ncbi:Uncharacterized protein TCM_003246 [Theobroma cacao]|uniref:Uncharacterized protein n=1 Tax=Theobroma cacao TaxID=3641 RepID=A0A061DNU8_THECC|nr:Uncharacterized protein TCM_003246 [Theobroma cacao]
MKKNKQKGLVLKSLVKKEKGSIKSESENEGDLAMLGRKFKKFIVKNSRARKTIKRDVPKEECPRNHLT